MPTDQEGFTSALTGFFLGTPEISHADSHARNLSRLHRYFGVSGETAFDGSRFDVYAVSESHPDRITPADLVAVTLLSMQMWRWTRSGITTSNVLALEDRASEIWHLLAQIPADRDLHQLTAEEYRTWVGPDSVGVRLWRVLRDDIGMHRVASFKLIARKRPRLFPIADRRTEAILGTSKDWWESWYTALKGNGDLVLELQSLRDELAQSASSARAVSLLRIADVALWNSTDDIDVEESSDDHGGT